MSGDKRFFADESRPRLIGVTYSKEDASTSKGDASTDADGAGPTAPKDPEPSAPELGSCEFCGAPLTDVDDIIACEQCPSRYHAECWDFSGKKCVRVGCTSGYGFTDSRASNWLRGAGSAAGRPMRISSQEVSASVAAASRRFSAAEGAWRTPGGMIALSAFASYCCWMLFCFALQGVQSLLGQEAFAATFALPQLYSASQISPWWIIGAGILYGSFHRAYLLGSLRRTYPFLRFALVAATLLPYLYICGFLFFFYGNLWPDAVWGFAALTQWMTPGFSWMMVGLGMIGIIGAWAQRHSLFEMLLGSTVVLCILLATTLLGSFFSGLSFAALGWLFGAAADFIWPENDFATNWSRTAFIIGSAIGFYNGLVTPFKGAGGEPSSA